MKSIYALAICLGALLFGFEVGPAQAQGQGIVSIDHVEGAMHGDTVVFGRPIRFVIRIQNDVGSMVDVCNGFRLTSPDGAVWDSTTLDTLSFGEPPMNWFRSYFKTALAYREYSCDGIPPDTVGVLGAGFMSNDPAKNTGLPVGFNDTVLAVVAWSHDAAMVGKHICVDSSFWRPGGSWVWITHTNVLEPLYPTFLGLPGQEYQPGVDEGRNGAGYCFYVEHTGVISVPLNQPTIQAAIDTAQSGDTIIVAPGTYTGPGNRDLDFKGKAITIKSSDGPASTTIVCGGRVTDPHRGFYFHSGENPYSRLEGFTIREGVAPKDLVVVHDIFTDTLAYGGGVLCVNNSNPTIIGNIIISNQATHGGGGMACYKSHPTITANRITGNRASLGAGLLVSLSDPGPAVSFTVIDQNIASNEGGGVAIVTSSGSYANNTIVNNVASIGSAYFLSSASPAIDRSILSGNHGGSAVTCGSGTPPSNPVLTQSDVFGNDAGPGCVEAALGTNGNISLNPLYCNLAFGNYSLVNNSPCAPDGNGSHVLMGANDLGCSCCIGRHGDVNLVGIVDLSDLSSLVSYLTGGAFVPGCPDAANVNGTGIIDLSDLSSMVSYLTGGHFVLPDCPTIHSNLELQAPPANPVL